MNNTQELEQYVSALESQIERLDTLVEDMHRELAEVRRIVDDASVKAEEEELPF